MDEQFELSREEMMEFFDSDEFLEQPYMQMFRREMERKKMLVSNPVQIVKMDKAYQIIKQIIEKEMIDADISIEREELTHTTAAVVVYANALEGSKGNRTIQAIQTVLDLCDCYLILPAVNDRIMIEFTFHNIMTEVAPDLRTNPSVSCFLEEEKI